MGLWSKARRYRTRARFTGCHRGVTHAPYGGRYGWERVGNGYLFS